MIGIFPYVLPLSLPTVYSISNWIRFVNSQYRKQTKRHNRPETENPAVEMNAIKRDTNHSVFDPGNKKRTNVVCSVKYAASDDKPGHRVYDPATIAREFRANGWPHDEWRH